MCCCVLGSWFSCWMEQYDRPSVIHLCPFSYSLTHTHMAAAEGNPALFMRCIARRATGFSWEFKTAHTQYLACGVSSFLLSHTVVYITCCRASIYPICCYGLAEPQLFECDPGLPQQCLESCRQMRAECGAFVFIVAAAQEGVVSSACQRSREAIPCSDHTKSL